MFVTPQAGLSLGHRIARFLVAAGAGIALTWWAWDRATDPGPAEQRAEEEAAVLAARGILGDYVDGAGLEIVDPLAPRRGAGRAYVYPAEAGGWEVSGHYRRRNGEAWQPFLMRLDADRRLLALSLRGGDPALLRRAEDDERLTVTPPL